MKDRALPGTAEGLRRAAQMLEEGGVGAFPTDTVYGLGARIDHPAAVARVFHIKGRSPHQPLPVLIADLSQLPQVARAVPPLALLLARHFWPGGLTLVLPRAEGLDPLITAGGDTVAVRLPHHPIPLALIQALGVPLVGTSANRSGQPAPTTAQGVVEQLGGELDFVLDGGPCSGGRESTVIDICQEPPQFLRLGAVPREKVEEVMAQGAVSRKVRR